MHLHPRTRLALLACAFLASTARPARSQSLVADIHPGIETRDAEVFSYAASGSRTFFVAANHLGRELWVGDGTTAGTRQVVDLVPGSVGSDPRDLFDLNGVGTIVFAADDGVHGRELWRSDGTAAGTFLVKDIQVGTSDGNPGYFFRLNGEVHFSADDGSTGYEMWKTDGTARGTVRVMDWNPGPGGGFMGGATPFQGKVLITADDGFSGPEPTITDGTFLGTSRLADASPGSRHTGPDRFTVSGSVAFFVMPTGGSGDYDLWMTDGTSLGTRRAVDLSNHMGSTIVGWRAAWNGGLLFTTLDGFFFSDGTTFHRVLDPSLRQAYRPFPFAGRVWFFVYRFGVYDLWSTDGTPNGARLEVNMGSVVVSIAAGVHVLGSRFLFSASSTGAGEELWISDGTAGGTQMVLDIDPGAPSSAPTSFFLSGNRAWFTAATTGSGRELWITDGTPANTRLLATLAPDAGIGSRPQEFHVHENELYFSAEDPVHGRELWRSDGTAQGTRLVVDLVPGTAQSAPQRLQSYRGDLYFTAIDANRRYRFFRSDGTPTGTSVLANFEVGPIQVFRGEMFFPGQSATSSEWELWKSDGTLSGTTSFDLVPGPAGGAFTEFLAIGDRLYFVFGTATHGMEPWVTDGTSQGTYRIADLATGSAASFPQSLTELGGKLLFVADDGVHGKELWVSDGTSAGTQRLTDLDRGPLDGVTSSLVRFGDAVYFVGDRPVEGRELWKSDGTPGGTSLVVDLAPGPADSGLRLLEAGETFLYLWRITGTDDDALWRTDGTAQGTLPILDPRPGPGIAYPRFARLVDTGDTLLFAADDGTRTGALWTSDGTTVGTRLVRDLDPGGRADPYAFTRIGTTIFFAANEFSVGPELWSIDLRALGGTLAVSYGAGCSGSQGVPQLVASRSPRRSDLSFFLEASAARPGSPASLILGTAPANVALGSCTAWVGGSFGAYDAVTSVMGTARWFLPIPNQPALLGAQAFAQAWILDPGGAFANVASSTAALRLLIGS